MYKVISIIIFLLSMHTLNAQFMIDDMDDEQFLSENGKSVFTVNLNFPTEYFRIKECPEEHISYAKPINGEDALKREIFSNMQIYLDKDAYAPNGNFYFIFEINPKGEISNFELKPNVVNGEMFYEDMKFIIKRIKQKWFPANCNGVPMTSKVRMKVNFRTEMFDM